MQYLLNNYNSTRVNRVPDGIRVHFDNIERETLVKDRIDQPACLPADLLLLEDLCQTYLGSRGKVRG